MLERAREKRARRRDRLQLVAIVAEADDHRLRVETARAPRAAGGRLVEDQLAEVDDGRHVAPRRTRRSARRCPRPAADRSRCPDSAGRVRLPEQLAKAPPRAAAAGTRRRRRPAAPRARGRRARPRPRAPRGCAPSRRTRPRAPRAIATPRGKLLVAAHRVLELRAVRLDDVARAGRRGDGSAEHDVICEDESAGKRSRNAAAFSST